MLSPPPPLAFLVCACSDLISSLHRQGKDIERRKTRGISVGISIAKIFPRPNYINTQQPKAANTIPKATCQSHLSTPDPETSSKFSTVESTCPYLAGHITTENQWQYQNATQLFLTLQTSILIGWTQHHRTDVTGPKIHTVKPHPLKLHSYIFYTSIMSKENRFCAFMDVVKNFSTLRAGESRYNIHSRIINNFLVEYE